MTSGASEAVFAAALASLPGCSRSRLRGLLALADDPRPSAALWHAIATGTLASRDGVRHLLGRDGARLPQVWRAAAAMTDLPRLQARLDAERVEVVVAGDAGYPAALDGDPDPPAVLFARTDAPLAALVERLDDTPRVAIVGTRRCTHYGSETASQLGRELAASGVSVVSGLALGIDGAAHEGALAAGGAAPVAVVGSGLDVVYPRRHRRLWARVAEVGVVFSEAPLGAPPDPWRFPLRNRIIAGLAHVVVVVESHTAGGSMHTVQAALDRDVPVMAVPGSVRSASSAGTNRLLAEGVAPALDVDDVLVALSLVAGALPQPAGRPQVDASHPRPQLDPVAEAVLQAVDFGPTPTEEVLRRTGLGLGPAATALGRLEMAGLVRTDAGWWERLA